MDCFFFGVDFAPNSISRYENRNSFEIMPFFYKQPIDFFLLTYKNYFCKKKIIFILPLDLFYIFVASVHKVDSNEKKKSFFLFFNNKEKEEERNEKKINIVRTPWLRLYILTHFNLRLPRNFCLRKIK